MLRQRLYRFGLTALLASSVPIYALCEELDASALDIDVNEELSLPGLALVQENPLTPYALKKNGKAKRHFKVPYNVLVDYYNYSGQGAISENTLSNPLLDFDMGLIFDMAKKDVEFYIDLKRKKAYPSRLINPESISELFILQPQAYTELFGGGDFLEAKRLSYKKKEFKKSKLSYERDLVHLEDWRSLNHPPVRELGDDLTVWDKEYTPVNFQEVSSTYYSEEFQNKIDDISHTELTFGNKVHLLSNGDSYQRKMEEIKGAKKSVLMAVMSFFCDPSSRELENVLIKKVAEGVDVKLMVEKVWTKLAMKKCMNRMIKGGVDVVFANDLLKKGEESALFHNKFMIIDNSKVIMGGSNIVESDNISTGYNHMNRDNDVYVEGPIATEAILSYVMLWKKYMNKNNEMNQERRPSIKDISVYETIALEQKAQEEAQGLRGKNRYGSILRDKQARNEGVCRFLTQNPDTDKHKLSKVFIEYMKNAQERINLTTGSIYFDLPEHKEKERARDTWNKRLFRSIFAANERGVKLDIIGNGIDGGYGEVSNMINRIKLRNRYNFKPIHKTIYAILTGWLDKGAAKKNQPYLEFIQKRPNARAWSNFQYMHAKMMQFDRLVNIVSSYNLEEWSADKSHETAIICMDKNLSQEMDRSFLRDFVNSVPAAVTSN